MRLHAALLTAGLVLGLAGPGTLAGQQLEPGKWTGTITPPNEAALPVTYDVKVTADSIAIVLDVEQIGSFSFRNIKLAEGVLKFEWTAGDTPLTCELKQSAAGGYAGSCTDAGGEQGQIVMEPPKKEQP
jgi:hypothetical protein